MKQISGNRLLVKALKEEGVDVLFGYPGACTIDISDELYKQNNLNIVLPRHEQALVHEADAYARTTGKVGVCPVSYTHLDVYKRQEYIQMPYDIVCLLHISCEPLPRLLSALTTCDPTCLTILFFPCKLLLSLSYNSCSKREVPMVPSGIFTPKFSAMVAPITAKVGLTPRFFPSFMEGE